MDSARPVISSASWRLPAVLIGLAAAVLFFFDPNYYPGYPLCLFHKYTGLLCPGCGSLRALHQLLHGHVAAALHLNLLLVLALPLLGLWTLWSVRRDAPRKSAAKKGPRFWFWFGAAVVMLFGILRNLPFARAAWLAP